MTSPLKDLSDVVLFEDVVQYSSWNGLFQSTQENSLHYCACAKG